MSIQKKSLISTLKTAKKANVASTADVEVKGAKVVASMKTNHKLAAKSGYMKAAPRHALKGHLKSTTKAAPRPAR